MIMHEKFTKIAEKQITEDWQREIPSLGIYKPRHLLRRVGPLLVGICLDRDSGGKTYKPGFHVHFLGKEFPTVSLTLWTPLRSERSGGPDFIQVKWHEQKYKEAAKRMVRQSLLPLNGDLRVQEVISAYREYIKTPLGRLQTAPILFRDMIILLAWTGDKKGASSLLDEIFEVSNDETDFKHVGGKEAFKKECKEKIDDPKAIKEAVESQLILLECQNLPLASLVY